MPDGEMKSSEFLPAGQNPARMPEGGQTGLGAAGARRR